MSSHEKSPQAVATGERAGLNTHENHTTASPFSPEDEAYEALKDASMRFGDGGCWGTW